MDSISVLSIVSQLGTKRKSLMQFAMWECLICVIEWMNLVFYTINSNFTVRLCIHVVFIFMQIKNSTSYHKNNVDVLLQGRI